MQFVWAQFYLFQAYLFLCFSKSLRGDVCFKLWIQVIILLAYIVLQNCFCIYDILYGLKIHAELCLSLKLKYCQIGVLDVTFTLYYSDKGLGLKVNGWLLTSDHKFLKAWVLFAHKCFHKRSRNVRWYSWKLGTKAFSPGELILPWLPFDITQSRIFVCMLYGFGVFVSIKCHGDIAHWYEYMLLGLKPRVALYVLTKRSYQQSRNYQHYSFFPFSLLRNM